jgi:FkbM family methyltransferase
MINRLKEELLQYGDVEQNNFKSREYGKILRKIYRRLYALYISPSIPKRRKKMQLKYDTFIENNKVFKFSKDGKNVQFYLPLVEYENNFFKGDLIQCQIISRDNYYEFCILDYIAERYLEPKMNILDIGTNIGNHLMYFAIQMEANKVIGFEPVASTYKILKKNVELNELENVEINNFALGKEKSTAKIDCFSADNIGKTSLSYSEEGDISVQMLDELEIKEKVDFIKIDVEGFEEDVLLGGLELIQKYKPIIWVEIFESSFEKVNSLLESLGYTLKENLPGDNYVYCSL